MELIILLVIFIFIILNSKIVEGSIFSAKKKAKKVIKKANKSKQDLGNKNKNIITNIKHSK